MKFLAIALVAVLPLVGCSKKDSEDKSNVSVDVRGNWSEDRTYLNEHFQFQISIPSEWHLVKGQQEHVKDSAVKFVSGDDKNFNNAMESAIEKMFNPFWAYRHPPGTPGVSNPNVTCIIENVKHLPGIKNGGDYLLIAKDTMKMANAQLTFLDSPKKIHVDGLEFYMQESKLPMGNMEVTQRFYAQRKGDYILIIGINLMTEEDKKTIEEVFSTIKKTKG